MPKQLSTVVPDDMAEQIEKMLEERKKIDPMTCRADIVREIIRNGLPPAKPLAISHVPKVKA